MRAERLQEPGESLEAPELAGMSALGLEQLFVQAVSNGKQEAPGTPRATRAPALPVLMSWRRRRVSICQP
ncbi:MAG: hypothetical protein M5U30_17700 [Burkholderiaceae bacterium]|nr:hypothetical protein [Burkholderiaceae bacterium]